MSENGSAAFGRPIPPVTPDTEDWWNATRERRLMVQTCGICGHHQFYPRAICTSCGSDEVSLTEASGEGRIYSVTIVQRSPDPENFPAPYAVALIRLEEGPMLLSNIVGMGALTASCEACVTLAWEKLPDGRNLPIFQMTL